MSVFEHYLCFGPTFAYINNQFLARQPAYSHFAVYSRNKEKIIKIMCDEHEFSMERVEKFADKLLELSGKKGQRGLF